MCLQCIALQQNFSKVVSDLIKMYICLIKEVNIKRLIFVSTRSNINVSQFAGAEGIISNIYFCHQSEACLHVKVRDCILPKAESAGCEGEKEVIESCNKENCPDWTPWTDWTPCTKTCGEGSKTRGRECVIPADRSGVQGCQGEHLETMKCNIQVGKCDSQ